MSGVPPNVASARSLLRALRRGARWRESVSVLRELEATSGEPIEGLDDPSELLGIVTGAFNLCTSQLMEIDLKKAPAHVLLLQQVNERWLATLKASSGEVPRWEDASKSKRKMHRWKAVVGNESSAMGTTLAVAHREGR